MDSVKDFISKKKKIFIVVLAIVVLVAVLLLVFKNELIYRGALKDMNNEDYSSATKKFEQIIDYKDSKDQIKVAGRSSLENDIETLINDSLPSFLQSHDYAGFLKDVNKIRLNEFYSNLGDSKKQQTEDAFRYAEFLDYIFNYDSDKELSDIDYSDNQFWGNNLKNFYNGVFAKYERKKWEGKDSYKYYDDTSSSSLYVETRIIVKYLDESKAFSDDNFKSLVRVYASYEGPHSDSASNMSIPPDWSHSIR